MTFFNRIFNQCTSTHWLNHMLDIELDETFFDLDIRVRYLQSLAFSHLRDTKDTALTLQ